eukprot:TRINITY_DN2984_c0_g3_i1.p1 TRINITY_DN2984_c0_g3~~TRINITY_DN2984_c0_g3_i1.p1  ORF type:complete len:451 (+),score=68.83 TRINITY_DN2984_c0_g3_i1:235-1587(+)
MRRFLARKHHSLSKRCCSDKVSVQEEDDDNVFTKDEIREMIKRTWEEKLQMGEEELAKVQQYEHIPIFKANPMTGYAATSLGPMPVPFQFHWSSAVIIGGFAEYDATKELIQGEDLHLVSVKSDDDKPPLTPVLLWVWQHSSTTTSVGQHSNSIQLYNFVSRTPVDPVPNNPLIHHKLMGETDYPEVRLLPHAMWEESEQALAYNREILGFPTLPTLGYCDNHTHSLKDMYNEYRRIRGFSFVDTLTGHTIMKGENPFWQGGLRSPTTYAKLAKLLGPKEMLLRQLRSYERVPLISPKSSYIPHHADSEILFTSNHQQLRLWGKGKPYNIDDRLLLGKTRWAGIRFTPKWVNHVGGAQGVITTPINHNGEVNNLKLGWESEVPTFPHLPLGKMSPSLRHGRIPDGSPIEVKGMAHLPAPDVLEARRLILSLKRRGIDPETVLKKEPAAIE